MIEYFLIGKIVAAHGVKGELLLHHELGKKTALEGLKALFIEEKENAFLPWFISSARARGDDEILLQLETVNTRDAALKLVQKKVWLKEQDYKTFSATTHAARLLGYTIIDGKKKLGEILEVIEQPHQLLCRLELRGKEVLVPLHENSLKKIDHNKKQVLVALPEGLLDVYLP